MATGLTGPRSSPASTASQYRGDDKTHSIALQLQRARQMMNSLEATTDSTEYRNRRKKVSSLISRAVEHLSDDKVSASYEDFLAGEMGWSEEAYARTDNEYGVAEHRKRKVARDHVGDHAGDHVRDHVGDHEGATCKDSPPEVEAREVLLDGGKDSPPEVEARKVLLDGGKDSPPEVEARKILLDGGGDAILDQVQGMQMPTGQDGVLGRVQGMQEPRGQDVVLGRVQGKQEPAEEDVVLDTVRGRQEPDTEDVVLGTHQDMQGLTMRSTGWPRSSRRRMATGTATTAGTSTSSSGSSATSASCRRTTHRATSSECWRRTKPGADLARFSLTTPTSDRLVQV